MTHHLLEKPGDTALVPADYERELLLRRGPSFLPAPLEVLDQVAMMLAKSGIVPHLAGQPGRCMAVAYAAARHNMDPIAFAGETYFTPVKGGGERMAYMSKLVSAIITSSGVLKGRLRPTLYGTGSQRFCKVVGRIKGEVEPFEYVSPIIGQIQPKHSPLWFTEPDQQLVYYSKRGWCRRNAEDILLGVYDPDEFEAAETEEVQKRRDAFDESDLPEPEPSAAAAAPRQQRQDQQQDQSQGKSQGGKRQQRQEPAPPESGEAEPPDMPEVRAACLAKVEELLKEPPAMVSERWVEFTQSKDWGRLKAYNKPVAQTLHGRMARHLKGDGGQQSDPG